jgi:nicotinate-nucleotide pyrophosphorylase (carboxylating)
MAFDPLVDRLVALALEEDLSLGDVTTDATIASNILGSGRLAAKEDLILAGRDVAERVFAAVDSSIDCEWLKEDGDSVEAGEVIAWVRGSVVSLLRAERTVLNFMQRLSGVATLTRQFTQAVEGLQTRIVDTRKTTPGWRTLEKSAVRVGGAYNHRFSLGSGVLIKDNHVDSGGGVARAIASARTHAPHVLAIEIEVRTLDELNEAIQAGADIVLLDNMTLEMLREAVARCRASGVRTEASGGISISTVRGVAETGVDFISSGALTHSAPSMDIHMKVRPL